jgi:hypothetical protein
LAKGVPGEGYPYAWSVYRWLEGEVATVGRINDLAGFATALADFLTALQRIDPAGGPPPGRHNFLRGGPLTVYDAETRQAIAALDGRIDADAATAAWEAAFAESRQVYARREFGSTANKITTAKPTTPIVARTRSVGVGAKANPGAAERMLITETTMVSHRAHRLSTHSPPAPMRPSTPSTTPR